LKTHSLLYSFPATEGTSPIAPGKRQILLVGKTPPVNLKLHGVKNSGSPRTVRYAVLAMTV